MSTRKRIVYLTDNINAVADLSSENARMLWLGAISACERADCDLVSVVGGALYHSFGGRVYDLIDASSADGFITWITSYVPPNDPFFNRFNNSPMVCITKAYGDHPCISISSLCGIQELMEHLIDVHGYRSFAFISGPDWHPHVFERMNVWRDFLMSRGLDCGDFRVSPNGPWTQATGAHGISVLIDERGFIPGKNLDVCVCASDRIALGVLDELTRRGYSVPGDIAVTGYDHIQEIQCTIPSITTVNTPFAGQMDYAIPLLLGMMDPDAGVPDLPLMQTHLVVNESCGCRNRHFSQLEKRAEMSCDNLSADLHAQFTLIKASLHPSIHDTLALLARNLFQGGDSGEFIEKSLELVVVRSLDDVDQLHWQDAITIIKRYAEREVPLYDLGRVYSCLERFRIAINDIFVRKQTLYRRQELRRHSIMRYASTRMGFCTEISCVWNLFCDQVISLGIPGVWVSLYAEGGDAVHAPDVSVLHCAVENGVRKAISPEGMRFSSRRLFPEGFGETEKRQTLIVYPLKRGGDDFGFIVFRLGPDDGSLYESLSGSVAAAIHGVRLPEEVLRQKKLIELSLSELEETRERLVESEKLAALGGMVAGVAHEMNTPVGNCLTASSFLANKIANLSLPTRQEDCRLMKPALDGLKDGADIILKGIRRTSELIEKFKLLYTDTIFASVPFSVMDSLGEIAASMKQQCEEKGVILSIRCDPSILIIGHQFSFKSILVNLITNSLVHAFLYTESPRIDIVCEKVDEGVSLEYSDNGCGMDAETLAHVYDPFFTTKRGKGGTGLGMHIVHNLLFQQFKGSIQAESSSGNGVLFRLVFPRQ